MIGDAHNSIISGPEALYLSRYIMRIVGPGQARKLEKQIDTRKAKDSHKRRMYR